MLKLIEAGMPEETVEQMDRPALLEAWAKMILGERINLLLFRLLSYLLGMIKTSSEKHSSFR